MVMDMEKGHNSGVPISQSTCTLVVAHGVPVKYGLYPLFTDPLLGAPDRRSRGTITAVNHDLQIARLFS